MLLFYQWRNFIFTRRDCGRPSVTTDNAGWWCWWWLHIRVAAAGDCYATARQQVELRHRIPSGSRDALSLKRDSVAPFGGRDDSGGLGSNSQVGGVVAGR